MMAQGMRKELGAGAQERGTIMLVVLIVAISIAAMSINLLFNPPPNFVEVPRPVLVNYAPIFLVRNADG